MFYLYNVTFITDTETHVTFNESSGNKSILTFDSRTTDRKIVSTDSEFQFNRGSTSNIISSKNLIAAHLAATRAKLGSKVNNFATFDLLDVRNYFDETDGIRYPKDITDIENGMKNYLN